MTEDISINVEPAPGRERSDRDGRNAFVWAGGILGLGLAIAFLAVAPARKVTARPSPVKSPAPVEPSPTFYAGTAQGEWSDPRAQQVTPQPESPPEDPLAPREPGPVARHQGEGEADRSSTSGSPASTSSHETPPQIGPTPPLRTYVGSSLASQPQPKPRPPAPSYTPSYTPSDSGGGTVHVRGYYRKDGTYVRPHTRRAPRR